MNGTSDPRDDAFVKANASKREQLDLWAVWPDGTDCALSDKHDLAWLLMWKSDDYVIKCAIGYDNNSAPIWGVAKS